jgi:hypothetical protein
MNPHSTTSTLTGLVAGVAVASTFAATPASFAGPADLRAPAATHEVPPAASVMAASAREQYGSLRSSGAQARQDLRSPDARDAAAVRGAHRSPRVVVVRLPQPATASQPQSAGGIDWADAGIGAAGVVGLSLIALGGTFVLVHRRRGADGAPPVAGL